MFDYLQQFNSLPKDLRDKVSSASAMEAISSLEKKYQVDLAMIVMKVMTKSLVLGDLPAYLNSEFSLAPEASLALTRELAPVFTSIVVSARAGAGMATELGSMRITEQIDALATMAINPLQYLIVPRVVAGTLMVPMLTMLFNCVGMLGAYIVSVGVQNVDKGVFLANARWLLDPNDITQGMVKAVVFGCVLTLIACNQGYNASGGAKGVGVATTRAVVGSFVTVLILDYFMTDMWLTFFNRAARG